MKDGVIAKSYGEAPSLSCGSAKETVLRRPFTFLLTFHLRQVYSTPLRWFRSSQVGKFKQPC